MKKPLFEEPLPIRKEWTVLLKSYKDPKKTFSSFFADLCRFFYKCGLLLAIKWVQFFTMNPLGYLIYWVCAIFSLILVFTEPYLVLNFSFGFGIAKWISYFIFFYTFDLVISVFIMTKINSTKYYVDDLFFNQVVSQHLGGPSNSKNLKSFIRTTFLLMIFVFLVITVTEITISMIDVQLDNERINECIELIGIIHGDSSISVETKEIVTKKIGQYSLNQDKHYTLRKILRVFLLKFSGGKAILL